MRSSASASDLHSSHSLPQSNPSLLHSSSSSLLPSTTTGSNRRGDAELLLLRSKLDSLTNKTLTRSSLLSAVHHESTSLYEHGLSAQISRQVTKQYLQRATQHLTKFLTKPRITAAAATTTTALESSSNDGREEQSLMSEDEMRLHAMIKMKRREREKTICHAAVQQQTAPTMQRSHSITMLSRPQSGLNLTSHTKQQHGLHRIGHREKLANAQVQRGLEERMLRRRRRDGGGVVITKDAPVPAAAPPHVHDDIPIITRCSSATQLHNPSTDNIATSSSSSTATGTSYPKKSRHHHHHAYFNMYSFQPAHTASAALVNSNAYERVKKMLDKDLRLKVKRKLSSSTTTTMMSEEKENLTIDTRESSAATGPPKLSNASSLSASSLTSPTAASSATGTTMMKRRQSVVVLPSGAPFLSHASSLAIVSQPQQQPPPPLLDADNPDLFLTPRTIAILEEVEENTRKYEQERLEKEAELTQMQMQNYQQPSVQAHEFEPFGYGIRNPTAAMEY